MSKPTRPPVMALPFDCIQRNVAFRCSAHIHVSISRTDHIPAAFMADALLMTSSFMDFVSQITFRPLREKFFCAVFGSAGATR